MRLVIDTATRHAVVALGSSTAVRASIVREVVPGRGTPLLTLLEEVLGDAGATMADVEAIGVGTGPGSFTGLRAGLATAKTLCWRRTLPLVALPTDETLRQAAARADASLAAPVAVVLPAGARDHYLCLPDADPMLVPPTADLASLVGERPVVGVDLPAGEVADALAARAATQRQPDPRALGAAARGRLAEACLALLGERLAAGRAEDPATLVPRYVALPRGIPAAPVEGGTTVIDTTRQDEAWSRTHP